MTAIMTQAEPWEHYLIDDLPEEYEEIIKAFPAVEDELEIYKSWKPMGRWAEQADCATVDPELFHVDERAGKLVEAAKAVCAGCPVIEQCLLDAIDRDDPWGIWGGMTYPERMAEMVRRDLVPASHMVKNSNKKADMQHFKLRGRLRVELMA